MRPLVLFAFMLVLPAIGLAQPAADSALIGVRVERFPSFPGGELALHDHVKRNLRMPQAARSAGIEGTVFVAFLIDTAGVIHDPHVERGLGFGCDEEAVRVVRAMPPWEPGTVLGRPHPVRFILPIRFDRRTRSR